MQYVETKDDILVRHTQGTIFTSYLNDMSKYNNLNEIKKTRLAYDNITVQRSRFMFPKDLLLGVRAWC